MKNLVVFNSYGINEIVDESILEGISENDWEVVKVESNIVEEYKMYDGVCLVKYDESVFNKEEVLEEVNRLDEVLW